MKQESDSAAKARACVFLKNGFAPRSLKSRAMLASAWVIEGDARVLPDMQREAAVTMGALLHGVG